jgi:hypothetical protein
MAGIEAHFTLGVGELFTTAGPTSAAMQLHEGGQWAVHEHFEQGFTEIVHRASACALPARFSEPAAAMRACHAIAKLKNDWSDFTARTASRELKRAVRNEIEKQHGVWFPTAALSKATAPLFDASMAARRVLNS